MHKSAPEVIPDAERELVIERVAAVDVAKASGKVCVRLPGKSGRRLSKVWDVPARTGATTELGEQLIGQCVQKVTVESTSDYWRIWYYLLEAAGLSVQLVNAREVKNVPGRPKTDKRFHHRLIPLVLPAAGGADGPLLLATRLCARAAPRTPAGPDELTPAQGSTDIALRRDISGSAPPLSIDEAAGLVSGDSTAHTLAPSKRLLTPRSARRVSTTNRGLLPGARVPTGTGLPPASPVQLSGRNITQTLRAAGPTLRNAPTADRMEAMTHHDSGCPR
ncbi:hypothetical protein MSHI_37250 [Mycobacterium shinjukuense]|uniref:Transposase n=1 Tax=Mycobacterium shinjukuense TaxID=398694 RepID=A0A7I7MXC8_9MYCO|nr:hypothetical protein MSHI_37250 [Mycobacterium shinjukuense]